jgi:hypothetical protein
MSNQANQRRHEPAPPAGSNPERAGKRYRACLAVVAFLGIGVLAAACGASPGRGGGTVLGTSATAGTGPSAARTGGAGSSEDGFFAYVRCMHAHGEPNMPYPTVSRHHGQTSVKLSVKPGSGFNPRSPRFADANKACERLWPAPGSVSRTVTITPRDRTDYLKGAACMRSHGFPEFPDPVFQNGGVAFNVPKSIDTRSPRYLSAVTTCEKLIPAGLPYSSPGSS